MTGDYEKRLGTEKMVPLVLKMSIPAVVAQLVNLLYSIVDRIYIGHIPGSGTNALAGIGVTSSVIILISAFAQFAGGGGAPLCAIALGQNNREKAQKILGNSFFLLIFFTVITMIPIYAFMKPILGLIGASETTMPYAVSYLSVYLIGTVFVMIANGLNVFITSQGRSDIAMISVLIGAVLNIALDPLFIFGFGMGVVGAALATVISQAAGAVWILKFLLSDKASLKLSLKSLRPKKEIIMPILGLGISPFIMGSTESLIGFVLNGNLAPYGDIYVSTLTVLQSAMMVVSVPLNGFGQGVSPIISYNYGKNNAARVKEAYKVLFIGMFSFNFVLSMLMILFPRVVALVFTRDPVLIETVSKTLPVFMAGITIFGLQRACQNTFVALGEAKISLFIALLRKVFLLIPLAFILPIFMGVMGVYTAEAVADAVAAICCMTIFIIKFPKIIKKMDA